MKQRNLTITLLILLAQFLSVQAQYNDCCSAEFLDQFTSNSIEINLENRGPATVEACGIQSENAVWISFVSDGNPLDLELTLLNPSNQEMRIALLENCYNEINCNLIPMTNTVTFSSGALNRYQQYYIIFDGLNASVPHFTISGLSGLAFPTGSSTREIDISANPIIRAADFRWKLESDIIWLTNKDLSAIEQEVIDLEIINVNVDSDYELEITPRPQFIYERPTEFKFYYEYPLNGQFRVIEKINKITRTCLLFDQEEVCLHGCGELDTSSYEIPWFNIEIHEGGDYIDFQHVYFETCDEYEAMDFARSFGQNYWTSEDAINEVNPVDNVYFGAPTVMTVYARDNTQSPNVITEITIEVIEIYMDDIAEQYTDTRSVNLCDASGFYSPPISPRPQQSGYQYSFYTSLNDAYGRRNPISCPYVMTEDVVNIYYVAEYFDGCELIGEYTLIYTGRRGQLSMKDPQCSGNEASLNFEIEGTGPFEINAEMTDGTILQFESELKSFSHEFTLIDYSIDNCIEEIIVTDLGRNNTTLEMEGIENSCIPAITVAQVELFIDKTELCEGEDLGVQLNSTQNGSYHLTILADGQTHEFYSINNQGLLTIPSLTAGNIEILAIENEAGCNVGFLQNNQILTIAKAIEVTSVEYICNEDRSYSARVEIINDNGQNVFSNAVELTDNNSFTLDNLASDQNYQFELTNNICSSILLDLSHSCECLTPEPIQLDQHLLCEKDRLVIPGTSQMNLPSSWSSEYILHDSPDANRGNIYAQNSTGSFSFDPNTMDYEKSYFVSRMIGLDDGNGSVDMDGKCSQHVSNGKEVLWFSNPENLIDMNASELILNDDQPLLTISVDDSVEKDYSWMRMEDLSETLVSNTNSVTINSEGTYVLESLNINSSCRNKEIFIVKDIRTSFSIDNVYIPNSFSPNNDGINDNFEVFISNDNHVEQIEYIQVFSRWGEKVFEANNLDAGENIPLWDGKKQGQDMGQQIFLYQMKIRKKDGKIIDVQGDVMLVR